MGTSTAIHDQLAEQLSAGIAQLLAGSPTFSFLGTTYTVPDVPSKLLLLLRWHHTLAAHEAITRGAQEHSLLGRTFKQADLRAINDDLKDLGPSVKAIRPDYAIANVPAITRTGPRIRYGVPLG